MSNLIQETLDNYRIVTLDRPEALNSLNAPMVEGLLEILDESENDSNIRAVFIKGEGGRAFCAGGDIKAARLGAIAIRDGRIGLGQVVDFFVKEYGLNRRLFHYAKPLISFMNGITMGGGVGIAGACKIRIATEKTAWAMPEVSIGFFPDVGAAYYLTRAPQKAGYYLALTGGSLSNPADLLKCGFATHYMQSDKESAVLKDVSAIDAHHVDPGEPSLPYGDIENCFSANTVEGILDNLDRYGTEWASGTAALIRAKSPSSLKVALRHLQLAEGQDFDTVSARDLKLAGKFLQHDDLIEGVRAVVVDKDRQPKWSPATLAEVGMDQLAGYFS